MKIKFLFVSSFFVFFMFFSQNLKAQKQTFYVKLLKSLHLENDSLILQPILFDSTGIVYNKIAVLDKEVIRVNEAGKYEINGFVNINPGVKGSLDIDKIDFEVYLIKNYGTLDQTILSTTGLSFTYGNLDVSQSFDFEIPDLYLLPTDDLRIFTKYMHSSLISINTNEKYHHVNKPTGMMQIAAMRIHKKTDAY